MASAVKGSKELDEQQDEALAEETETLDVADGDLESNDSKLKTLLGILKKVIGVKDLANMRLSLPANLMEPVGNLESWHYCDRPDLFAAVGDRDIDALTRFIAVVRWILTKDLRYVRTRISKPYNSALGERFRCAWEVAPASASDFTVYQNLYNGPTEQFATPNASPALTATGSPLAGAKKLNLPKSISNLSLDDPNAPPTSPSAPNRKQFGGLASSASSMTDTESLVTPSPPSGSTKVAYVTEQICHHPPISAFWYETTSDDQRASVQASGIDQIAAKFNGTSIKIAPGSQNKGIFVKVPEVSADIEYQITHPVGYLTGFISRAPYATLAETTYINTLKNGKKEAKSYCAILTYAEESWISKPKFLLDGVIYEVADGAKEYTRIKDVPSSAVVATIKGTWRGKISTKRTKGEKSESTLVDVSKLDIVPKSVRPLDKQDPMESRRFWDPVSVAIRKKDYKLANTHKQTIEQRQRDIAAERTKTNEEFVPVFFDPDISSGRASLTSAGQKTVKEELDLVDRKR